MANRLAGLLALIHSVSAINVLVFLPGTTEEERKPLTRIAQDLAFRNHGTATFKSIIIPEKRYLVKPKIHLARELSLPGGVDKEIYEEIQRNGNGAPWASDYDFDAYRHPYWEAYARACESVIDSDLLDRLGKDSFDVALVYAGNPCSLGVVHALSIPFIYFDLSGFSDEIVMASASPSFPGYIPSSYSIFSQSMTMFQRWKNLWLQAKEYAPFSGNNFLAQILSPQYRLMDRPVTNLFRNDYELKKRFPQFPDVNEIKELAALYFVNSDPALEFAGRATMPNVIFVGGSHIEYPRPLFEPYNVTNAAAKEGVIVFSFGHVVNSSAMTSQMTRAFMDAFRRLPDFRVYWKTGLPPDVHPPDFPPNVNATVFLPQSELLGAKETRLLITHGGMNSIMEAVNYGIPILGVPLMGPNYHNLRKVEAKGMALILEKRQVTADSLLNAIKELTGNPKYRMAARAVSRAFKDRPMSPLETVIYWIEYVGRHHGAPHLSPSPVRKLKLHQYLLLDVVAVLVAGLYILQLLASHLIRRLLSLMIKSRKKGKKAKVEDDLRKADQSDSSQENNHIDIRKRKSRKVQG